MNRVPTHPAKFTDSFIPIFSKILIDEHAETVLDPFAGVGKIGAVKKCGYNGVIIANEIEEEWIAPNTYNCDVVLTEDAEKLRLATNSVDAICTSPTYGNRMADHHNAKDGSKRMTYTHCLGRPLTKGNTGEMQWGGNTGRSIWRSIKTYHEYSSQTAHLSSTYPTIYERAKR